MLSAEHFQILILFSRCLESLPNRNIIKMESKQNGVSYLQWYLVRRFLFSLSGPNLSGGTARTFRPTLIVSWISVISCRQLDTLLTQFISFFYFSRQHCKFYVKSIVYTYKYSYWFFFLVILTVTHEKRSFGMFMT